jgi:hypothetical protein
MEITFILPDIKEIDVELVNFLYENGFDDCTPYNCNGKSFLSLSLEDENPDDRLQQLAKLGIKAEICSNERS